MRNNKSVFALLLVATFPAAAQDNAKPASVQGTVTNSITGAPVQRAHVTLQGGGQGNTRYGATSGADGKFSFINIAPGTYSVQADRVGFVSTQSGSPQSRIVLKLSADDSKTAVDIKLVPTGEFTGRVTDSAGDPVENAQVEARGAKDNGFGVTDEDGRYRIGGLAPGKYTVRTTSRRDYFGGPAEIRTDGTTEVHNAQTYYPGVLAAKEAGKVTVRGGAETPGVDIRMMRTPFVRVSGKVLDIPSGAHADIEIDHGNQGNGMTMNRDGTFALWRLDPGKYTIAANWQAPNGEQVRTVGVPIEIAGSNIDNIELRVVPDSDISGRLEFEDDNAKKLPKRDGPGPPDDEQRIGLSSIAFNGGSADAPIDAHGAFQLKKVAAGKYRVQVTWGDAYVKSVRLGTTQFEGAKLEMMNGSGGAELSVLMAAANGTISGTVQDSKGPAANLVVVLVPVDDSADDDDSDGSDYSEKIAEIKPDGTYSFDHIAPGDYQVAAIPEDGLEFHGHQVTGYEDQMETVTVRANDKITKDLKYREQAAQ